MLKKIVLLVVCLAGCVGCQSFHDQPDHVWRADKPVYIVDVGGMWHEDHAEALQNAVRAYPGVEYASAGWGSASLVITMRQGYEMTQQELLSVIDSIPGDQKYQVRSFRPYDGNDDDDQLLE